MKILIFMLLFTFVIFLNSVQASSDPSSSAKSNETPAKSPASDAPLFSSGIFKLLRRTGSESTPSSSKTPKQPAPGKSTINPAFLKVQRKETPGSSSNPSLAKQDSPAPSTYRLPPKKSFLRAPSPPPRTVSPTSRQRSPSPTKLKTPKLEPKSEPLSPPKPRRPPPPPKITLQPDDIVIRDENFIVRYYSNGEFFQIDMNGRIVMEQKHPLEIFMSEFRHGDMLVRDSIEFGTYNAGGFYELPVEKQRKVVIEDGKLSLTLIQTEHNTTT